MARSCCCTGYLTNPGGRCCMDVQSVSVPATNTQYYGAAIPGHKHALTEEDIRRIIREELDKRG